MRLALIQSAEARPQRVFWKRFGFMCGCLFGLYAVRVMTAAPADYVNMTLQHDNGHFVHYSQVTDAHCQYIKRSLSDADVRVVTTAPFGDQWRVTRVWCNDRPE